LAGFNVSVLPVSGDKITRAEPFAAQVNAGNVRLIRGDWNKAYIDELKLFPLGANDDQVDGSADAFNTLFDFELQDDAPIEPIPTTVNYW
jgi:predicted phage terminase large subunit-like protein